MGARIHHRVGKRSAVSYPLWWAIVWWAFLAAIAINAIRWLLG